MMSLIKNFVCVFVFAAVAWAQDVASVETPMAPSPKNNLLSREHRGFFFSAGLGLSYMSSNLNSYSSSYSTGASQTRFDGVYEERWFGGENNKKEGFSGFGFPTLDVRMGRSVGNLVAIYASMTGSLYNGEGTVYKEDFSLEKVVLNGSDENVQKTLLGKLDKKEDGYAFYISLGLGFSVYPFRDAISPLNGFYVGISGGADVSLAKVKSENKEISGVMGIFTRYELGKDWWVSDTWSIGVGFAFTKVVYENVNDGDDGGHHFIGLFFRITRG
ncbi:hypothetical protein [Fibrobacter sp.]|uniref:hypothetical protein n=1 Tax=Fibrobacter sp. TaxID=35828 RepID=UPI0025C3B4D5|nr:hypothetical protein [Fibrobacter sp.]MBR3073769.1 hypothetical protein [Fibrobacter sp.]